MKFRSEENTTLDLEEKIMGAWQTVEDLDVLYHGVEEMDEDQFQNAILGLREFHELRMGNLWRVFEQYMEALRKENANL